MPVEENTEDVCNYEAACSVCGESRTVVADCKSWHLTNSNETIAKRINAWQRNKNPFIDASRLFADGVQIDSENVSLPICQPCLNVVIDIDRLEACLKDRFDALWNVMKFDAELALEYEVVYENDEGEEEAPAPPDDTPKVEFDVKEDDKEEPESSPQQPVRRSRGRPNKRPRPPSPSSDSPISAGKRSRGRPKRVHARSPSPSPSESSISSPVNHDENGLVNGTDGGRGRKNKGNRLRQVLDRVKSKGLSPKRKGHGERSADESRGRISTIHGSSRGKPGPKSPLGSKSRVAKASPRTPPRRNVSSPVKKKVLRRLSAEEVALRVTAGLMPATSAIALKRAVGVRSWLMPDCRACDHIFSTHLALRAHYAQAHDGLAPYVCHFCLLEFTTLSDFSGHVMYEELQRSCKGGFKCGNCGEDCRLPALLAEHVKKCCKSNDTEHPPFVCNECGLFFDSFREFVKHRQEALPQHVRKNTKRAEFKCRDCKSHCPSEEEFIEHYQSAHNVSEPFGCARCGQMFPTLELLHVHFVTVEFDKKHVCKRCGLRFSDLSLAKGHRKKSHALDRALTCITCSANIPSVEEREKHEREHTNGACPFCAEDFWIEGEAEIDDHFMKHHGDNVKLICPVCDQKLDNLALFRWHLKEAHVEDEFAMQCDACVTDFSTHLEYALHRCVLNNSVTTNSEKKSPANRLTLMESLVNRSPAQEVPPETTDNELPSAVLHGTNDPQEDLLSSVIEEVFSPGESYTHAPVSSDGGWLLEACQEEVIEGPAPEPIVTPDLNPSG